jgi:plastocyanin
MRRVRFLALAAAFTAAAIGLTTRPADAQPAAGAALKGQVVFPAGKPIPKRDPLNVTQDKQHCLKDGNILDESVVVNEKTRGIKNVVVWMRPDNMDVKKNAMPPGPAHKGQEVVIDQPCCMFVKRVTVAQVGDTLVVKNPAPVAHNFFWVSSNNGELNVTIPKESQYKFEKPLQSESGVIEYKCTIHPWMNGYVRVFDHPYYAVTDENGNFEVKNAPVGKWRLVVWHETKGYLGGKEGRFGQPVEVTAAGTQMKPIEFEVGK